MKLLILAAVAALITTPAFSQNPVRLDQDVTYYDVRGMTEPEIAQSLRRDAPRSLDGFQGETTFYFEWRYDYDQIGARGETTLCEVSKARVEIKIEVTLPRHRTIARAPDAVEEAWRTFIAALERHEMNHARDFAEIGAMMPEALNGLTGPCSSIEDIANAKGMDYVDRAQKSADDYDAATNHGETEGTFFPGI
jgi:predicted secreted Zn-dependent protease